MWLNVSLKKGNQMTINSLKQWSKTYVPKNYWERLSQAKMKLSLSSANFLLGMIHLLPLHKIAYLKERIQCVGRLDYPRKDIYMRVDSLLQIARLHACEKEPETINWIESLFKPGDIFYDIGANVGAYSFVAWAVAHGDCAVYAFEPSFSTYAALNHNILLNHCQEKVVSLQVILSNETKLTTLNYSQVTPGAASHGLGDADGENGQRFHPEFIQSIPSYRLDDIIKQFSLRIPNHIKIDVDGAEYSVLQGAMETLAHPGLRSVLVEIDEERYPYGEIPSLMISKGFRLGARHLRSNSNTLANYIFEK